MKMALRFLPRQLQTVENHQKCIQMFNDATSNR